VDVRLSTADVSGSLRGLKLTVKKRRCGEERAS